MRVAYDKGTISIAASFVLGALLVGLAIASTGCGKTHQAALRDGLTGLNAARDAFLAYDEAKQQTIVDDATSETDGQQKLAEYRKRREKVLEAFTVAYTALAAAAIDPGSTAAWLEALGAAKHVYDLVRALKEDP